MPYNLFISYSRRDNEHGQVTTLAEQIKTSFRAFAGEDLRVFLDVHPEEGIRGMDDWQQKIQRSLRDSQLFLAVLSPHYLASPYCRWEWEDYVRYEAMRQCLGEGVAPVFFVTLPDAADPKANQALTRWIEEIRRRQTFDLRPWHDMGEQALEQAHIKKTLEELNQSVSNRLNRSDLARKSPNNLIKHNPAFVGRVRELTELRNALTKNKLGVVGAREGQMPNRATVQGLGGMGKTELALAYAHAFAWDYPGGRWQIPCEHVSDLRVALLHLANANALNIEFTDDEKKNVALAFERVLRELNRCDRCLLILDNVSDPNLLQPEYLDRLPRNGRVDLIATTRLAPRVIPGSANEQAFIVVDELPEEDALALMRSHQPEGRFASQQEDDEARAIVRLLRGFTLAVETAAIYLGRNPGQSVCRGFRDRLSPELLQESEAAASDPSVAVRHRVRSLEATLAFTLKILSPEALHLLTIAAELPADEIAVAWLQSLGGECFPALVTNRHLLFHQGLDLLLGLRLLQSTDVLDTDGGPLLLRMHRLVQDLVRKKADEHQLQMLRNALDALVHIRAGILKAASGLHDARWEIRALTGLAWLWVDRKHRHASWLLTHVGQRWKQLAEWGLAESVMRKSLELDENNPNAESSKVAISLNNLAVLLWETSRFSEAEPLMRRVLALDEKQYGAEHPEVATDLNNLALLLYSTDQRTEGESLMRRALAIDREKLGPAAPDVARDMANLTLFLVTTGRFAEAEPLARQAVAISSKHWGYNHPKALVCQSALVRILIGTGHDAEANQLMQGIGQDLVAALGPQHPMVAMLRLAEWNPNDTSPLQGANSTTLECPEQILENSYGKSDPHVAEALRIRAQHLNNSRQFEEAEKLVRRALSIDREFYGESHSAIAEDLLALGECEIISGKFTEGEDLLRRAMDMFLATVGENDLHTLQCLESLAGYLMFRREMKLAANFFERAFKISFKANGLSHGRSQRLLASWNECKEQIDE